MVVRINTKRISKTFVVKEYCDVWNTNFKMNILSTLFSKREFFIRKNTLVEIYLENNNMEQKVFAKLIQHYNCPFVRFQMLKMQQA